MRDGMIESEIMQAPPFEVTKQLEGWGLFWAELAVLLPDENVLREMRKSTENRVRELYALEGLSKHPTVAGLRRLFRNAGCDPTRYRPASEALLRRLLKGNPLPAIHPLVDLNNCLSAELAIPCCVMAAGTFEPPVILRAGKEGESYESLKGPFNLEKKPLLGDRIGPLDAPITGSKRVMVKPDTERAWLVSYFPEAVLRATDIEQCLTDLVERSGCFRVCSTSVS